VQASIKQLCALSCVLLTTEGALAQVYLPPGAGTFSGFADGDLVGQNGWTSVTTTPTGAQVVGGKLVFQGGLTSDPPDARYPFSATVPNTGGTTFYVGAAFRVTQADQNSLGISPVLSGRTTTAQDGPVLAVSGGSGPPNTYWLLTRGGPSNSGTGVTYATDAVNRPDGQTIRVILAYDFVNGASNDMLGVYVNPSSPIRSNNTAAYTLTNFVSSSSDFSWQELTGLTGVTLSPQGTLSSTSPGLEFDTLSAAGDFTSVYSAITVPEPSALALVALPAASCVVRARRSRVKELPDTPAGMPSSA
jgi:hypothetical protein